MKGSEWLAALRPPGPQSGGSLKATWQRAADRRRTCPAFLWVIITQKSSESLSCLRCRCRPEIVSRVSKVFFFFFLFHFLLRRPDCAEPPPGTQLQPPPCEELPGDQSAASSPTPGKTAPAECADGGAYFHVFTTVTMSQDSAAHLRFSWDV